MQFKIGDKVRCVASSKEKGAGWELGREFTVTGINRYGAHGDYQVLFGQDRQYGVYSYAVIPVIEHARTYDNIYNWDSGSMQYFSNADWSWGFVDEVGTITPKETKMTIGTMMRRVLDKDMQTLVKAGFVNGNLDLTDSGKIALLAVLFDLHKKELVAEAEEVIAEANKK